VLWVSDEGPGIAPEVTQRIFEAFQRGEVHGQSGVGLGLAIAAQAAKLLEATLTVESRVGAGSTFRLALPEDCGHGPQLNEMAVTLASKPHAIGGAPFPRDRRGARFAPA
jgi:K+-sensing histidine kinase KdpD